MLAGIREPDVLKIEKHIGSGSIAGSIDPEFISNKIPDEYSTKKYPGWQFGNLKTRPNLYERENRIR